MKTKQLALLLFTISFYGSAIMYVVSENKYIKLAWLGLAVLNVVCIFIANYQDKKQSIGITHFDSEGKFIETKEKCHTVDCILLLLSNKPNLNATKIRYELFIGGVYLSFPETRKVLEYMINNKLVKFHESIMN